ncbi:MAG: accessory gene regulator B family protein [Butyrivibrio sp.]|nr:accessory gene regulator B family protein [Muribaculum sp.]MCM1553090.1 accessory gene regulator B family protein [Butyrivibrio sp.]
MKNLSIKIADVLLKKQYIEAAMYPIYQYGVQMVLEIGFSMLTSLFLCCLWGKMIEGIIFFAIFIPLRSFLGGFHMKSYGACYICSCATLALVLGLSSVKVNHYVSWSVLCVSVIIIFLEAKREKLRDADGAHFYPRICMIILVILTVSIVFTLQRASSKLFLIACTSILVAASKLLDKFRP